MPWAFLSFLNSRTLASDSGESMSATERGVSSENGGRRLPAGRALAQPLGQDGHEDLGLLVAVAGQLAQAAVQLVAARTSRHTAPASPS